MRTVSSALVLALVFVTTAWAQSSSPSSSSSSSSSGSVDRGKTSDAAPPAGAQGQAASPDKPTAPYKFFVNGAAVIPATPPKTPEQQKADEEARAVWQARCRPRMVEDRDGMRRMQYAAVDCDLSEFNTAGEP